MDDTAIKVDHVSKTFKLPHEKQSSIKGALISKLKGGNRSYEKQEVLKDISFEIKKGEFFGIVGRNGSGKSTLLKMLAGIYAPTRGNIQINGKLTPFIELGVGFNVELTGRENVFLNGSLLGFSRKDMAVMYDDIVEFAELERFMDQKLKNYSSGMQVRLAFSIAIRAQSDILLLDEVLAVGDAAFQQKCFEYFRQLKKEHRTIVLVSHDRSTIEKYCSRAALIDKGDLIAIDDPKSIFLKYAAITREQLGHTQFEDKKSTPNRMGSGEVEVEIATLLVNGKPSRICKPDDELTFRLTCKANAAAESPVYGITVNRLGEVPIFVANTLLKEVKTKSLQAGEKVILDITTRNIFADGKYYVSPAIANATADAFYDFRTDMLTFMVSGQENEHAVVNPPHNIVVHEVRGKR